jgi:lysophospholipase L1-like esterase
MKVIFFGDSICNGQGIAIHKGWVTRISARLSELAQGGATDVTVINSSVNGRTTRQALENMPYEVQSQEPEVLLVQFGMNDCNTWASDRGHPRVSTPAFEANLREIIQRGFLFGCRTIVLNTNHPSGRDQSPLAGSRTTYESQNRLYNEIIRKVARSDPRVHFNDIEAQFHLHARGRRDELRRMLLPDLLHLSEEGHDLYFESVYPRLARCVLDLLRDRDGTG